MTKSKYFNFFLSLETNIIKFDAINESNEIFFSRNNLIDLSSNEKKFEILEKFLKNNIFEIEKELNRYVKNINLIVDDKNFLSVSLSTKYNSDGTSFNFDRLNSSLIELKKYFQNTNGNFEIAHMIINKFSVDGKDFTKIAEISNYNKIFIEIKFICLNKNIIENFKNILSKYQIFVKNIICFEYLREFENFNQSKSTIIAQKVLNGLNQNEIFYTKKSSKKLSFFEKFFNFFN